MRLFRLKDWTFQQRSLQLIMLLVFSGVSHCALATVLGVHPSGDIPGAIELTFPNNSSAVIRDISAAQIIDTHTFPGSSEVLVLRTANTQCSSQLVVLWIKGKSYSSTAIGDCDSSLCTIPTASGLKIQAQVNGKPNTWEVVGDTLFNRGGQGKPLCKGRQQSDHAAASPHPRYPPDYTPTPHPKEDKPWPDSPPNPPAKESSANDWPWPEPGTPTPKPTARPPEPPVPTQSIGACNGLLPDDTLAYLAYATYGDSNTLNTANAKLRKFEEIYRQIERDPKRNDLLRAKELQRLEAHLAAASELVAEREDQLQIRDEMLRLSGLEHMDPSRRFPRSLYQSPGLSFDIYRGGDHVTVAFRGTDDAADLFNDLLNGISPELISELSEHKPTLSMKTFSGLSWVGLTTINHPTVSSEAERLGLSETRIPGEFAAADRLVAALIRAGFQRNRISLTGHSLGGALAAYSGLRNGVSNIVTFNPLPFGRGVMRSLGAKANNAGSIRNYVSIMSVENDTSIHAMDPVSNFHTVLDSPRLNTLSVLGQSYGMPLSFSRNNPAYQRFAKRLQHIVNAGTLNLVGLGGMKYKLAGVALGGAYGAKASSVERTRSSMTGGKTGGKVVTTGMAVKNCIKHPYLCAAAAAGGAVASAAVGEKFAPKAWALREAHRMKPLLTHFSPSPECFSRPTSPADIIETPQSAPWWKSDT
jgi:hypothetical protein